MSAGPLQLEIINNNNNDKNDIKTRLLDALNKKKVSDILLIINPFLSAQLMKRTSYQSCRL
jgi:hypothetical protein